MTVCPSAGNTDEFTGPTDILYNPVTVIAVPPFTNIVVDFLKFIVLSINTGILTLYNVFISFCVKALLYNLTFAICPTNPRDASPLAPIVKSLLTERV